MNRSCVALMVCLLMGAVAGTAAADDCRRVHASIDLSAGTIEGNAGLDGTVLFVSDGRGTPPETAPAGSSVFSGILTITTDRGVLEMRETGMFSSRTGSSAGPIMSSWGDVLGGTDRYAGATGDVSFVGRITDGRFLVVMAGELCRP